MTKTLQKTLEAIKDIVAQTAGLEYKLIRVSEITKAHNVNYYTVKAMHDLGIIEVKKQGNKTFARSRVDFKDIQPKYADDVQKRINKIHRSLQAKKQERENAKRLEKQPVALPEVPKATQPKSELPEEVMNAVRTLKDRGFTVKLTRTQTFAF